MVEMLLQLRRGPPVSASELPALPEGTGSSCCTSGPPGTGWTGCSIRCYRHCVRKPRGPGCIPLRRRGRREPGRIVSGVRGGHVPGPGLLRGRQEGRDDHRRLAGGEVAAWLTALVLNRSNASPGRCPRPHPRVTHPQGVAPGRTPRALPWAIRSLAPSGLFGRRRFRQFLDARAPCQCIDGHFF